MDLIVPILITLVTGLVGGGCIVFFFLTVRRAQVAERAREAEDERARVVERTQALDQEKKRIAELAENLRRRGTEVEQAERALAARRISYEDLQKENEICKRDLRNIEMSVRKSRLDLEQTRLRQTELDERGRELASRYLKENVKAIGASISVRNYTASKQRLLDVIGRCRAIGYDVPAPDEEQLIADLKEEFEKAVRAELEREEQARIRAQIREEQKLQREIDREIEQAERERKAIQAALAKALAEAKDVHSLEVEQLQAKLAEAEARSQRAMSQAQMTKAGNVYVISNIGAFGEGVFKVGMTRRLEPTERVDELGSASVPFPYDIHMMISSPDAPALENALHRGLHKARVNKVNPRKEFFRTSIETIAHIVEEHRGRVEYVADAEALEYRQSQTMTDEDAAYIEQVFMDEDGEKAEAVPDDQ